MIPEDKIEQIRERADIVDIISAFLPLAKRGLNYVGLCPFHSEKTPSFTVNEVKKIFYCFGCGSGGNVITFLMKHENVSFPDAVKKLAHRYGIKIAEEDSCVKGLREEIFDMNKHAADFFKACLEGAEGSAARNYLKERGYSGEILKRFEVGFAPSGNALTGWAMKKKLNLELASNIGLIGKKDDRFYDRFRCRIMFPIKDVGGRILGFGGRTIDNSEPKYLNSSESQVFKKGVLLYGLNLAKEAITKSKYALIVEGYFDLIALHLHGFTNSGATMGTALTKEHIRTLRHYTTSVYILFDGDDAGLNAALRTLPLFLEESMMPRVIALPAAEDPDGFLKKYGRAPMEKVIKDAPTLMDFFLKALKKRFDFTKGEDKAAYLNEAVPYLFKIENAAERDHYIQKVAGILSLDAKAVCSTLDIMAKKTISPKALEGVINPAPSNITESMILKTLIRHPHLYTAKAEMALGFLRDEFLKEVSRFVAAALKDGLNDFQMLDGVENEGVRGFIAKALVKDDLMDAPERVINDCADKILNYGKPKEATLLMVKMLQQGGLDIDAENLLKRVEKAQRFEKIKK